MVVGSIPTRRASKIKGLPSCKLFFYVNRRLVLRLAGRKWVQIPTNDCYQETTKRAIRPASFFVLLSLFSSACCMKDSILLAVSCSAFFSRWLYTTCVVVGLWPSLPATVRRSVPGSYEICGGHVTEAVRGDQRQLVLFDKLAEPVIERIRMRGLAVPCSEYPVIVWFFGAFPFAALLLNAAEFQPLGRLFGLMLLQQAGYAGCNSYQPFAVLRLWGLRKYALAR